MLLQASFKVSEPSLRSSDRLLGWLQTRPSSPSLCSSTRLILCSLAKVHRSLCKSSLLPSQPPTNQHMPCSSNSLSSTCRTTQFQPRAPSPSSPRSLRLTNRATATLTLVMARTPPRVDRKKGKRDLPKSPLPCRSPQASNQRRLLPAIPIASLR
jgi:hypothetical protein